MKNTIKRIAAFVLTAAIVLCCASCGLDMNKVKGDWTVETAAGKTVEEIAAANGVDIAAVTMNATVTNDSFTLSSATGSVTYKIKVKGNGFECIDDFENVFMTVAYDSAKDTISFKLAQPDGTTFDYVMKRGTADLTVASGEGEAEGEYAEDEGEYAEDEGEYAEDEGEYAEE